MKDEENEKTAWGRFRKGKDVPAGIHTTGRSLRQDADNARSLSVPGGEPVLPHFGGGNRLLKQNLAKAPPGRPVAARGHPPSGETRMGEGKREYELKKNNNTTATEFGRPLIQIENERFNTNNKTKQYKHLNFTIMKKQFLFLMVFVLVGFAGIKSYGQSEVDYLDAVPTYCVPAVPLTCGAGDALHPAPGVSYDYTITVSGTPSEVLWFVTDDANVVTAENTLTTTRDKGDGTGDYLLTSDVATYNNSSNTAVTISLTWKSFDGTSNNVLLVAYAKDKDGCTDNIEVYRIIPKYSFTLDIAGLADSGTTGGDNVSECVSPVQSATYASGTLTMDYGENWVFFTVNAANWQTSWQTAFTATTNGTSTLGTPQWAYPDQANDATAANWHDAGTNVDASHYSAIVDNGFIGKDGACIVIRVPVTHTNTENIADETINLVVNGQMLNPEDGTYTGYPDLDEPTSGTDCVNDLTTDNANYVITARPDINVSTPTPFETKSPADE